MNPIRIRIDPRRGIGRFVVCLGFLALTASAQTQTQTPHHVTAHAPAAQSGAVPQKMKAIWEPMNYSDDILIQDVFFANDKVGWISGGGRGSEKGGFIFHTSDGGANWDAQLGDPHSSDPDISRLQFLDARHGWAYQTGNQLLRTTDGTTWETVGPLPEVPTQFKFISARDGFEVSGDYRGSTIFATHDGGHNWKPVYQCETTLKVNGLNTNTSCYLHDVYFASTKVAYAVGGGYNDPWAAFVKTVDGGATWKVIFASTDVASADAVFFTDENNGVVRLHDKRVLITADGGQTWRGATGIAQAVIKFADPEVGWSCLEQYGPSCDITVDGGKSWISHDFELPSDIYGYSVPRRDRVYLVGDHGMIYRYRIVPADYTAQGIVDAPMVPTYGGALVGQLQQMQTQVAALQVKLGGATSALSGANVPEGGDFSQNASSSSSGGFSQDPSATSSATAAPTQDPPGASSAGADPAPAGQDATASGGFSQDTSTTGAPAQDPNAAAGGFVQDTSAAPASSFVQSCCATQVQALQTSFTSVAQTVPQFSSQFKNLNLLFVGLNMLNDMMTRAKQIKDAFVALKKAPNAQAALAALANLSTTVQGATQAVATQFQSLGLAPAAGATGGVIGNQAVGVPASDSFTTPTSAPAAAPAATPDPAPASSTQTASAGTTGNQPSSGSPNSSAPSKKSKTLSKLKGNIPPF